MPCFFCKVEEEGMRKLKKNAFKLIHSKYPEVTTDDTFCKRCYDKIQALLKRTVAHIRLNPSQTSHYSIINEEDSGSLSSSQPDSSGSIYDRLLLETPRNPKNQQTLREINPTGMRRKDSRKLASLMQSSEISSSDAIIEYLPTTQTTDESIVPIQSTDAIDNLPTSESTDGSIVPIQPNVTNRKRSRSQPIVASDDDGDDIIAISEEVPGPSSLANVQPLIKRRRTPIILANDSDIPIYRRSHVGG